MKNNGSKKREKSPEPPRKTRRRKKIAAELRRKKRRRLLTVAVGILICAVILFVAVYWLRRTVRLPDLTIRHVVVTDGGDKRAVADASDDVIGKNMFTVDVNRFICDIKTKTHARRVAVYRRFPDTLVVDEEDSALLFAVNTADASYYADDDARIIESATYLNRTSIPVLSGFKTAKTYRIGETLSLSPQTNFEVAVRVAKLLKREGMLAKISEISYVRRQNCYRIITKNNLNIEISTYQELADHIDYLRVLFNRRQNNENIDLKVGKNPIVRSR